MKKLSKLAAIPLLALTIAGTEAVTNVDTASAATVNFGNQMEEINRKNGRQIHSKQAIMMARELQDIHHNWQSQHGPQYHALRQYEHSLSHCIYEPVTKFETFEKFADKVSATVYMRGLISNIQNIYHPGPHLEPGKKQELEKEYQEQNKPKEEPLIRW